MLIKKLINIPIIQVIFMYILKISATKSIKITDRYRGMQNMVNCQMTRIRKLSAKLLKISPNFCEILEKF